MFSPPVFCRPVPGRFAACPLLGHRCPDMRLLQPSISEPRGFVIRKLRNGYKIWAQTGALRVYLPTPALSGRGCRSRHKGRAIVANCAAALAVANQLFKSLRTTARPAVAGFPECYECTLVAAGPVFQPFPHPVDFFFWHVRPARNRQVRFASVHFQDLGGK